MSDTDENLRTRDSYRVGTSHPLLASVVVDGETVVAEIVNLSAGGCCLRFKRRSTVATGQVVTVFFREPRSSATAMANALVLDERAEDEGAFGIRFTEPDRIFHEANRPLWKYFNRRGAYRVKAVAEAPVDVSVDCDGKVFKGRMADISSSGISIVFSSDHVKAVDRALVISISFSLPNADTPLRFRVVAKEPEVNGRRARCGFEYDADTSPNFVEDVKKVVGYVMAHQRDDMRLRQ